MSKLITLFCFLSTLFCSYAVAAESVTEYPYSENFDNTAEKEMPSGWAVEGERLSCIRLVWGSGTIRCKRTGVRISSDR